MFSKYRLIIGSINQMIIQQQLTAGFGKPAVNHHRCLLTGGFLIILSTLSAAFNCNNTLAYYCSLLYSSMTALISTSLLLIPVDPNPLDSTADVSPSDELPSSSSSDSVSTSSGHVHLACTPSSRPKRRLWRTAQDPIHRKLAAIIYVITVANSVGKSSKGRESCFEATNAVLDTNSQTRESHVENPFLFRKGRLRRLLVWNDRMFCKRVSTVGEEVLRWSQVFTGLSRQSNPLPRPCIMNGAGEVGAELQDP